MSLNKEFSLEYEIFKALFSCVLIYCPFRTNFSKGNFILETDEGGFNTEKSDSQPIVMNTGTPKLKCT